MPTRPATRGRTRRGRPRGVRGKKTSSLDMHRFKLRLTTVLSTDSAGIVRTHVQPYSLTNHLDPNASGAFLPLEEATPVKNLFDSYRVDSVSIRWIPYYNVNAPGNLPSQMPPFFITADPDDVGLAGTSKEAFITHKSFKLKPSQKGWTYTYKPPHKVGVSPGGALTKGGYMNLQTEQNESNGSIYAYIMDPGLPIDTEIGQFLITSIISFKNRQ